MSQLGDFSVEITHRADETNPAAWDSFSAGRPFSSLRWMRFGETVMAGCEPFHVHLRLGNDLASRATFWRVTSEPLPLPPLMRTPIAAYLRKHPLLICRAPLANWTGLLLPDEPALRASARTALYQAGLQLLADMGGSYLLFDFLADPDLAWPPGLTVTEVSDPGTTLAIRWDSFDDFLAGTDKRGRQHYKRVSREANELGLEHAMRDSVGNVEEALPLIRAVERKFRAAPNPWIRPMLERASMIGGAWQEVRKNGRLVGCGLLLEDNGVMFATALGLADDVQYAYFLLVYGCLQHAIDRRVKTLRLGSGAYDVKRRLGFELETNNHTGIATHRPALHHLARWMA